MMKNIFCLTMVAGLLFPAVARAQGSLVDTALTTAATSALAAPVISSALAPDAQVPAPGAAAISPNAAPAAGVPSVDAEMPEDPAAATAAKPASQVPVLTDPTVPFEQSFLFTQAELLALRRASQGSVIGPAILNADKAAAIPQRRVIALSGVYQRAPGEWVVWINGKKMTPKDLLPEVMDIRVEGDRVHLKWFDIGLNNVISITLRPHQTYDIVTGVLLPG